MDDYYPWAVLGLTALLVLITWKYVKITGKILEESRLQRLQDAEFRTIPQQVGPVLTNKRESIIIEIRGGFPTTSRNFIIEDSGGNKINTKGRALGHGKFEVDLSQLKLARFGKTFKLNFIVEFKSFLGHDWEYKIESADLIREPGTMLIRRPRETPEGPVFKLVEVIPPWERE